jgi:predicted aspartyl protease
MLCKRTFFIIILMGSFTAAGLGAQVCSRADVNAVKMYAGTRYVQVHDAQDLQGMTSQQALPAKRFARAEVERQKPAETRFVMDKHLRVPVRIVYHGQVFTALFALDTGAVRTVVSQDLAEKMGVQEARPAGGGSLSHVKASATAFKVSGITVGPLERKDYTLYRLHSDQKEWSQLKGMNILGMDILKEVTFCVDSRAGVIRWGNDAAEDAALQIETRAVIKDVRVFLPVTIVYKGQTYKEMFLLDTGSAQTFVTPVFAKMIGVPDARQGSRVKLSRIQAGPLELKDHPVGIWNTPNNLIGMDLLKYITFTIDYAAGVVRWAM